MGEPGQGRAPLPPIFGTRHHKNHTLERGSSVAQPHTADHTLRSDDRRTARSGTLAVDDKAEGRRPP